MLEEAYGNAAMKKMQVYDWHKCFHDGHEMDFSAQQCT
jgi:hypothetical protein